MISIPLNKYQEVRLLVKIVSLVSTFWGITTSNGLWFRHRETMMIINNTQDHILFDRFYTTFGLGTSNFLLKKEAHVEARSWVSYMCPSVLSPAKFFFLASALPQSSSWSRSVRLSCLQGVRWVEEILTDQTGESREVGRAPTRQPAVHQGSLLLLHKAGQPHSSLWSYNFHGYDFCATIWTAQHTSFLLNSDFGYIGFRGFVGWLVVFFLLKMSSKGSQKDSSISGD